MPGPWRLPTDDPVQLTVVTFWLLLTGAYLAVLLDAAAVVGISGPFSVVVIATIVCSIPIAVTANTRTVGIVGTGFVIVGAGWYAVAVPAHPTAVVGSGLFLLDTIDLLTGTSVLQITAVDTWLLAITPTPLLFSTVFLTKGRARTATAIGATMFGLLVLSGDAGPVATLVGTVGIVGAVAAADIANIQPSDSQSRDVQSVGIPGETGRRSFLDATLLGVTGLVAGSVGLTAIASETRGGVESTDGGVGDTGGSLDGVVVGPTDPMPIQGSVELDPTVRFAIESDEPGYWRIDGYDRYTGSGWIRTGGAEQGLTDLADPIGETNEISQTIRVEEPVQALPAIWEPDRIRDWEGPKIRRTREGGLTAATPVERGTMYDAVSRRPDPETDQLDAEGEVPPAIRDRYLQLPDTLTDRVVEYAEGFDDGTHTPYEIASLVEGELRETKDYSLSIERPSGDIVDGFLFEMDAAYCTYFATAMAVILRVLDIPTRVATGYSTGEGVDDDMWVVRGLNAHAWTEVYFPAVGWLPFEPTPRDPRDAIHDDRLARARAEELANIETPESEAARFDEDLDTRSESDRERAGAGVTEPMDRREEPEIGGAFEDETDGGTPVHWDIRNRLATLDSTTVGLALAVGLGGVVLARRTRRDRIRGTGRTSSRGPPDPELLVRREFEHLERMVGTGDSERALGETRRQFVRRHFDGEALAAAMDVVRAVERAEYGPGVAAETVEFVRDRQRVARQAYRDDADAE